MLDTKQHNIILQNNSKKTLNKYLTLNREINNTKIYIYIYILYKYVTHQYNYNT